MPHLRSITCGAKPRRPGSRTCKPNGKPGGTLAHRSTLKTGEVLPPPKVVGRDGKSYPRPEPKPATSSEPRRRPLSEGFRGLLTWRRPTERTEQC
jgi:hypothetical protein